MTRSSFALRIALFLTSLVAVPFAALAQERATRPLSAVLADTARTRDLDLLYSPGDVAGIIVPVPRRGGSLEQLLDTLLRDTGLSWRRTPEGTIIVTRDVAQAVPEILVIGHRTQNSDVRRSEDGIRPYHVTTRQEIEDSHANTLEGVFRSRFTANAQIATLAQQPLASLGEVRSEVNLRGLGARETLVLLDGRRMPRLPGGGEIDFSQPDVNALPMEAVERVEVINATAGGIYGPGATGGVVNLVLRRDYRGGGEFTVTRGITDRGDAPFTRVTGRIAFTPNDGRTAVMLTASRAVSAGLLTGQRDYLRRIGTLRLANDPLGYLYRLPVSDSINIYTGEGDLVLKPAFGGSSLGSPITFLPADTVPVPANIAAALRANAGRIDTTPSSDFFGERQSLQTAQRTWSVLASARHQFPDVLEVYADFVRLDDRGRAQVPLAGGGYTTTILASNGANPFQQNIGITFPLKPYRGDSRTVAAIQRATLGGIVDLPFTWRVNLDHSFGWARQELDAKGDDLDGDGLFALLGYPDPGRPALNPFGDRTEFNEALRNYRADALRTYALENRFSDTTIKLAGPVMRLAGGDLTATLAAEWLHEHTQESSYRLSEGGIGFPLPDVKQRTRSFYGELLAPLTSEDGGFLLLRGVELMAAVRNDRTSSILPEDNNLLIYDDYVEARYASTVYTLGGRVRPADGLMLRMSVATGRLPPRIDQLDTSRLPIPFNVLDTPDPQRGGVFLGDEAPYVLLGGGSIRVRPEKARSFSAGVVLHPFGERGLRIALDYTHIRKREEITEAFNYDAGYFLARENEYPDRIIRLPLTDADRAKGYTAGVVTEIDTTALNVGRTSLEAVDLQLDYPLDFAGGRMRLHGAATWQPTFSTTGLAATEYSLANTADGVLEWRANGGAEWDDGIVRLTLFGQYYGAYKVANAVNSQVLLNAPAIKAQGSSRVRSQIYFDASAAVRLPLDRSGARDQVLELRGGVQNLLAASPPLFVGSPAGYSYYADPRGRRFDLTISLSY